MKAFERIWEAKNNYFWILNSVKQVIDLEKFKKYINTNVTKLKIYFNSLIWANTFLNIIFCTFMYF